MSLPALEFDRVGFAYDALPVLSEVSLQIQRGEFVALIGPNGGGKSTLIKLALGLLHPDSGRIRVLGEPPRLAAAKVGYVPQFAAMARDFPLSVRAAVRHGRLGRQGWWRPLHRSDEAAVTTALEQAGVAHLAERPVAALSGGQLQRVLLARALAGEPEILLLDEPTAHVDSPGERSLFDQLAEWRGKMTLVVVSHDVGLVSRYVDRVACLNRTLVCHSPLPLNAGVLENLYGAAVNLVDHRQRGATR